MKMYTELFPQSNEFRHAELLDGLWRFQFDPKKEGDVNHWYQTGLPDSISMPVPASFADVFTDEQSRDYCGDFWYETELFIHDKMPNIRYFLRFGSITHACWVFLNGKLCTSHIGGFLPVVTEITDILLPGRNLLIVKVNNELSETNIPCGTTVIRANGTKRNMGYFDFFNYSGIQRSVYLMELPKEAIYDYELS